MSDSLSIFGTPAPLAAAVPPATVQMLDGSTRTPGQISAAIRTLTGSLSRAPERAAAAAELILSPVRAHRDMGEDYLRDSVVICADMAQDVDHEPTKPPEPSRDMGHHFEGLVFDECRATMRLAGFGFLIVALVAGISVAMAAPGKIARTGAIFDQIEGMR